jgi:hypothetical protein
MWLAWTQPDPDRKTPGRFHCTTCEQKTARTVRLAMHCGFLPRREWPSGPAALPATIGNTADPNTCDVCPGWLVRQPRVIDGATAYAALEAGTLDRFDPENLRVVNQAALIVQRGFNLFHLDRQQRISRGLASAK